MLDRDGRWVPIVAGPDVMVCDTGDMMQLISAGRLPSTTHRVVNPAAGGDGGRLSLPFFVHPHPSWVLTPMIAGHCEPIEARVGSYMPADLLLGLSQHLNRRQQANWIVEVVRKALCALRDGEPFALTADLAPMEELTSKRKSRAKAAPVAEPTKKEPVRKKKKAAKRKKAAKKP